MVEEERIRIIMQNDPERAVETQQQQQQFEQEEEAFVQEELSYPQPLAEDTLDASSMHGRTDASGMTSRHSSDHNTFGSSLEQDTRFLLMKARSESISSEGGRETPPLEALALSAEERRELEAEMQAQNKHPLALRLRMEEEERRLQNDLEHHRNVAANRMQQPRVLRLGGGPARRDWTRILNALEQERNANDDFSLLEATMTLSMEERRSLGEPSAFGAARVAPSDLFMSGLSEEEQLAMAIAASLEPANEQQQQLNEDGQGEEGRAASENVDDTTAGLNDNS